MSEASALTGNHKIAEELRVAALEISAQTLHDMMVNQKTIGGVLKTALMVAADIIDIYDEHGLSDQGHRVSLDDWPAARLLCELLAGGGLFQPGTPAPPTPPPTPQLIVAKATGSARELTDNLKRGAAG